MGAPTFTVADEDKPHINPFGVTRRSFLRRTAETTLALGAADFLTYFLRHGDPGAGAAWARETEDIAQKAAEPRYLIFWFMEGGWESYDMFSPVDTPNNIFPETRLPLERTSEERYRIKQWGKPGYTIQKHGNIRYGYLAEGGKELFPEMAVLSSMHTGSFHSGERLKAHYGSYNLPLQGDRQPDERTVMQAFAEVYGQPYVLPNLSWHWWLSDGELNEVQYTGRKGYYHALGPAHAHTIYAGPPANLRNFLLRMQSNASDVVNREIETFLDEAHLRYTKDKNIETVKSYNSAREIYGNLAAAGKNLNRSTLSRMFTHAELKERFKVTPADELITYQSINGNKARTKFCPSTNVQAMMTYEMMREDLSCAFWIETRDIRRFDTHQNRQSLWEKDRTTPRGKNSQQNMMNEQLWDPLKTLVDLLKTTPHKRTGRPLWEYTTIVLTSEFGRTIHGDVDSILKMDIPDIDKQKMIDGQDISEHWRVTSAAFLSASVNGDSQFGGIGTSNIMAIPLLPDGSMDPAYDPVTGEVIQGRIPSEKASIPNHGDVYATALDLCGISKKEQTGRNDRQPLAYIKKKGR
ncbi:MAG: hypothetical protein OHK0029_04080 [Armatimonadaceae bacterium]